MALSLHSRFTAGDCHILARTIHEATGWKMATFSDTDWGFPADCHAFVQLPNGKFLDIQGVATATEMYKRWFPYWSLAKTRAKHRIRVWDSVAELEAVAPEWIGNPTWAASERIAIPTAYKLLWQLER